VGYAASPNRTALGASGTTYAYRDLGGGEDRDASTTWTEFAADVEESMR